MLSKRFYGAALMGAIVVTSGLEGCSSDSPLCCNEFKAGAAIDANIGGSIQSQAVVQSIADFRGIADASISDLSDACRGMAVDLDATPADIDAIDAQTDKSAKMKAYCDLAVKIIGTVKAGATITLNVKPVVCSADISAKGSCEAKCSGSAKCDFKANPPKCTGGTLEVACKGECSVKADNKPISCEGSCGASCTGSCSGSATLAVDCEGKCDGTCEAGGSGSTAGNGIQADGSCKGTCKGTCTLKTDSQVTCKGSCKGTCSASCTGGPTASAKCSGDCKADYEPVSCSGGKLEGGCQVEAKCSGSCDASVSAKATCTPPEIDLVITGGANAALIAKLEATLKAHLGVVLAFKSRLTLMTSVGGNITANASAVADIKAACIPVVIAAAADAIGEVGASASATVSVAGSVGGS